MPTNFPRLEELFGSRLDAITAANVHRLVTSGVVEDDDLDFKREPHDDGEKLASDVCAMANTKGGVLVIGVDEVEGRASSTIPFELTDEGVTRMKQWLAELVVPFVPTVIRRVPEQVNPTTGYYIVIVPRSPNAPHAVRKRGSLRYYRRDGPRNHPLSESEVADRYRDRFRGERAQVDRFEQVRREGTQLIVREEGAVWMAMTLVPNAAGSMTMSAQRVRELERWSMQYGPHQGDGPFSGPPPLASTGLARVMLTSAFEQQGPPQSYYIELHGDGAGFASHAIHGAGLVAGHLVAEQLVQCCAGLLNVLVKHALTNTTTSGDAITRCELLAAGYQHLELGYWDGAWRTYPGTRELQSARGGPVPVAAPMPETRAHTINLDAVAASAVERLAATRLLLTDLVQAFGLPEVLQVTPEGHLNTAYWASQTLSGWRGVADVPRESYDVVRGR